MTDTWTPARSRPSSGEDTSATSRFAGGPRWGPLGAMLAVGILYSMAAGAFLMLHDSIDPDIFLSSLSLFGAACFFILWLKIDWGGYTFQSFGPLFLLASACYRLVSVFDFMIFGNRIETWPVVAHTPLLYVVYGEWTFVVGALLVVGTWWVLGGHQRSIEIVRGWQYDLQGLLLAYLVGLLVIIAFRVFELNLGFLGAILYIFFSMATVSVVLIGFGDSGKPTWTQNVFVPLALCVPLLLASIGTATKENIIISLLPVAIGLFTVVRQMWHRVILFLLMFVLFCLLTVFVNVQREARGEDESISAITALERTVEEFRFGDEPWTNALKNALSRKNLLEATAWSFAIVENSGHAEMFSPDNSLEMFIPRVLWAEKPDFVPGRDFSELLFGDSSARSTSTASGYFSALYLGGGVISMLIYSALTGVLYAVSLALVIRFGNPFAQVIFLSGMLYKGLRLDEAWPVYEFAGNISALLLSIVLGYFIWHARRN